MDSGNDMKRQARREVLQELIQLMDAQELGRVQPSEPEPVADAAPMEAGGPPGAEGAPGEEEAEMGSGMSPEELEALKAKLASLSG
jgi:hypothetical protein